LIVDPCKLFYLASAVTIDDVFFSVITLSYVLTLSSNNENSKETARLVTKKKL
jgi:hypothetical protein